MNTFVKKIFSDSGSGGEHRLENEINEMARKRNLYIVSANEDCLGHNEWKAIKAKIAREIFEEIEKHRDKIHGIVLLLPEQIAELKKKYTEGKDDKTDNHT